MKSQVIAVRDLDQWLRGNLNQRGAITIAGGLRGEYNSDIPLLPALELNGVAATTVKVLITAPEIPAENTSFNTSTWHAVEKADKKQEERRAKNAKSWPEGWAEWLTACAVLQPRLDICQFRRLLNEDRVVRLFCDTNALASGVAEWLLQCLPVRAEIISSAIADKEIMSWSDRGKLFERRDAEQWETYLRFLLARTVTEFPPSGTVVDRLSPDQNALMLAQGTGSDGKKSQQGDLLFVELARPLVREQPRQARVVFVTGDANVARSATSALGPEHVLYACADKDTDIIGKTLGRGFWLPRGPLGSVRLPPTSRLLWRLFACFNFFTLQQGGQTWLFQPAFNVRHGGPSDWANPAVKITLVGATSSPEKNGILVEGDVDPRPSALTKNESLDLMPTDGEWLLPPASVTSFKSNLSRSPRPQPKFFFEGLGCVVRGERVLEPANEVERETYRVLVELEIINEARQAGARAAIFREAWLNMDLDRIHAELCHGHPGYLAVVDIIRSDGKLTSRQEQFVPLMRALGQVTRYPSQALGDAPVKMAAFEAALQRWLPASPQVVAIEQACALAIHDLQLTPSRFARALELFWQRRSNHPVRPEAAGEPRSAAKDSVVVLAKDGRWAYREVNPGALLIGKQPVHFLARRDR